jgi:flagellar basal-body rod protein FlgB
MFEQLSIFQMASGLAEHASTRQELVARNIANADTPGYRAQDTMSFDESYNQRSSSSSLRSTRPEHALNPSEHNLAAEGVDAAGPSSPNGNTVALETEMMKATEVRHQHDLAMSVYKSSMNILRTSFSAR